MNPIEKLEPKDVMPTLVKIRDESKLGEEFFGSADIFLSILRQYQDILNKKMVLQGEDVMKLYTQWELYRSYQEELSKNMSSEEQSAIQNRIKSIERRKNSLLQILYSN